MGALTDQSLHSFVPSVGSEDRAGQANCEADAAQEETRGTPCTAFAALIILYALDSRAAFTNPMVALLLVLLPSLLLLLLLLLFL